MRVAVTGATGLIGSALAARLRSEGCIVTTIGRGRESHVMWDPAAGVLDPAALRGIDAIVHLAGAPISVRWTQKRRRSIVTSRVGGADLLVRAMQQMEVRPRLFVSGSAVGYYGDGADAVLTEESAHGSGFLADVVHDWETAAARGAELGVGVSMLRSGVVLSPRGGMLRRLLLPFRFGAGGRIGTGRQWLAWISLHDHVRAVSFVLRRGVTGVVNVTSPHPVRNAEFTRTFARVLKRPAVLPIPAVALRVVFGNMARETILTSQRVLPERLLRLGFEFETPELEDALRRELAPRMR